MTSISLCRFPGAALLEAIALGIHFEDVNMMGDAVEQSAGQALRAKHPQINICTVTANWTDIARRLIELLPDNGEKYPCLSYVSSLFQKLKFPVSTCRENIDNLLKTGRL